MNHLIKSRRQHLPVSFCLPPNAVLPRRGESIRKLPHVFMGQMSSSALLIYVLVNQPSLLMFNKNPAPWQLYRLLPFSLADVNYKNRYVLSGSFRRDASSIFGADNRNGNFYAVGATWNLNISCTGTRRILPIPQSEIQANPNIAGQQNPGY